MERSAERQRLPKATQLLGRAQRAFDELAELQHNTVDFRDKFPYVLELLIRVSALIHEQSKGQRTSAFSTWWPNAAVRFKDEITAARNAELKEYESVTRADVHVAVTDWVGTAPSDAVPAGGPVITVAWRFVGGPLHDQEVLPLLRHFLNDTGQLLQDAEDYLAGRKP
jgi:hypothetical protein